MESPDHVDAHQRSCIVFRDSGNAVTRPRLLHDRSAPVFKPMGFAMKFADHVLRVLAVGIIVALAIGFVADMAGLCDHTHPGVMRCSLPW